MSIPILQTRLFIPPVQPNQVQRPRLYERLQAGVSPGRRLMLVSAPPGSGKTTLLADWAVRSHERVAWLTLDVDHDDPIRFCASLLAALQGVVPDLLRNPPRRLHIHHILNGLAGLPGRVVLVLDDYHAITNPVVHEDVTLLLEGMPSSFHLVLATRVDPPLPIARLRARGQLNEIRAGDLRFSVQESAAFLNERMGLRLSAEDVESLEARTEGWIAGLQLAALSMQGRDDSSAFISAFTGSHHFLAEYLTEEVINCQPEPLRDFLIQTCILDRLNGALCSAVTGSAESARFLSQLEHGNLFTSALDDEHRWYRYHSLFADALRQRLEQIWPAKQICGLHLRASAWMEENGLIVDAVKHARAAGDFDRVARLAEQAARTSLLDSRMILLSSWLDGLPGDVVRAYPRLRTFQAWALFISGKFAQASANLAGVRQTLEGLPSGAENGRLRSELLVLLDAMETLAGGFMQGFNGSLDQAIVAYRAAREKSLAAGVLSLAAMATEGLALAQYQQGRLHRSAQSCREVIELGRRNAALPLPLAAAGHIELAGIYVEWNDRDTVERHLKLGMDLCCQGRDATILAEAYLVHSRLFQAEGDLESAFEALRLADRAIADHPFSLTYFNLDIHRIGLYLSAGRLEDADQCLRELEEYASRAEFRPASLEEARRMTRVRVQMARNLPQQAVEQLDELVGPAIAAGRLRHVMEIWLLKALALQAMGQADAALDALGRSLALAEPDGLIRLYLDEGAPAMSLLRQAVGRSICTVYASRLLALGQPAVAGSSRDDRALIDPLTPTETKVLHLIASGCSNREITEKLVVALDTVKRHTSHIYRKLDVRSRTQAIVCARRLGLLPPQPDF